MYMEALNFPGFEFKFSHSDRNEETIFDDIRKKYVVLTPEEWVRQHVIRQFRAMDYPASLIAIEKAIKVFSRNKRFDILINDNRGMPLILVECKAASVAINQLVFDQIARYNSEVKAPYVFITNGLHHYFMQFDGKSYHQLKQIPNYADIMSISA